MASRDRDALRKVIAKPFESHVEAVNCHHNYVQQERHFGEDVFVTRKGAVQRAARASSGIIPGSMGARSYIVRGKGNPESFDSLQPRCRPRDEPHRGEERFTVDDHDRGDRGRRVPQGRGRDRRDPDGLQGHRRGDGGAEGPGRGRAHLEAGGVREGVRAGWLSPHFKMNGRES